LIILRYLVSKESPAIKLDTAIMCQEWGVIYFAEDYEQAMEKERLYSHPKFLSARMTGRPWSNGILEMCGAAMHHHRLCPQETRHRQDKDKSKWYSPGCVMTENVIHLRGMGLGNRRYFFERVARPLTPNRSDVVDLAYGPVKTKKEVKFGPVSNQPVGVALPSSHKRPFSPSMHDDQALRATEVRELPSAGSPKENSRNDHGITFCNAHVAGGVQIIVSGSGAPVNASPRSSLVCEPKHIDSEWVLV
jgi:hypothetical protein